MSMQHPTVVYAEVDGWPGYRAGTDGTIQSRWNGKWGLGNKWKNLKPGKSKSTGYLYVALCDGKTMQSKTVHRLVAAAFIGPRDIRWEVCHENGIKTDNRLANLRYDTRTGNQRDRFKHGTDTRGSRHGMSKLTEDKVIAIRSEYATGQFTQEELGDKYGVSGSTVCTIISRKWWKHVSQS